MYITHQNNIVYAKCDSFPHLPVKSNNLDCITIRLNIIINFT